MKEFIPVPRCEECDKPISKPKSNKSGYCTACGKKKIAMEKREHKTFEK